MPSPFPGMNPYLESSDLWPDFHHRLIVEIAYLLAPQLAPKYVVAIEKRVYEEIDETPLLVGIPDVTIEQPLSINSPDKTNVSVLASPASKSISVVVPIPVSIRQGYLEIRQVGTNRVIAAIEVLSPVNKKPGKGRETYLEKRQNVFGSFTHLIEIDLLRKWEPMPILETNIQSDYRVLVSRRERRPIADLYPFNLPDPMPSFPVPLLAGDLEPIVDLKALLDSIYDRAVYPLQIDYNSNPNPSLTETDLAWLESQLKAQKLRI
jgi:Protein of unknown function (DUF4058)